MMINVYRCRECDKSFVLLNTHATHCPCCSSADITNEMSVDNLVLVDRRVHQDYLTNIENADIMDAIEKAGRSHGTRK